MMETSYLIMLSSLSRLVFSTNEPEPIAAQHQIAAGRPSNMIVPTSIHDHFPPRPERDPREVNGKPCTDDRSCGPSIEGPFFLYSFKCTGGQCRQSTKPNFHSAIDKGIIPKYREGCANAQDCSELPGNSFAGLHDAKWICELDVIVKETKDGEKIAKMKETGTCKISTIEGDKLSEEKMNEKILQQLYFRYDTLEYNRDNVPDTWTRISDDIVRLISLNMANLI
ncbi:uncharacterized protein LOC142343982 [Convolutriloba macropyga]|uniref:uncharacterized protein LOC142343982 n=1 Tax=Convolutriloba macropyga TaxID=536237 RepID=UPI003F51ECE3